MQVKFNLPSGELDQQDGSSLAKQKKKSSNNLGVAKTGLWQRAADSGVKSVTGGNSIVFWCYKHIQKRSRKFCPGGKGGCGGTSGIGLGKC